MRPEDNPKVAVLLCNTLEHPGGGLDLKDITTRLQDIDPSVHVQVVPGLLQHLAEAGRAVTHSGADRLVFGLSTGVYSRASLQLLARKAGLDPLGIEVVNLGVLTGQIQPPEAATDHALLRLSAAVAKAHAFAGSRPENLKPSVPARMSRRSLFSLPVLEYSSIPCANSSLCRVDDGCQQCVTACPHGALATIDGQIQLTKSRCTSCGICVSACPHDAMDLPGATPAQLSAEISSLLSADSTADRPRRILFLCHNSERALENLGQQLPFSAAPNWLPIKVPCLGILPPSWLLAPLTLGATAVGVLACNDNCRSGQSHAVEERVAFCQATLRLLGEPEERIVRLPSSDEDLIASLSSLQTSTQSPVDAPPPADPLAHRNRASVFLQLAQHSQSAPRHVLEHPESPFGVVEATDGCTLCGACTTVCPTQALMLEETEKGSSLSFESAKCVACAQCLAICPENQVLHLRRTTDLRRLVDGRVALQQDTYQRCEACGKPIASAAMSRRIVAMLGEEFRDTASIITRYCIDCRGWLS